MCTKTCYSLYMKSSSLKELREDLNLSQDQLASLAEVSRHAIIRLEQLCYPNPLPRVIETLSDLTGLSINSLEKDYLSDVLANRLNTGALLRPHHNFLVSLTQELIINSGLSENLTNSHPFSLWRITVSDLLKVSASQIHFSMMTSIHPATLHKYENFKTGFPEPIKVALTEMDLPTLQLAIFEEYATFNEIKK